MKEWEIWIDSLIILVGKKKERGQVYRQESNREGWKEERAGN